METIKLPEVENIAISNFCVLTSPPTGPDCLVLITDEKNHANVCCPGDSKWSKHKIMYSERSIESLVSCRKQIYALFQEDGTDTCSFALIDVVVAVGQTQTYQITVKRTEPKLFPEAVMMHYIMLESCNEIFLVIVYIVGPVKKIIKSIELKKFNFTKMEWEIVEILGDRAFFFKDEYGLWCQASKAGIKGNCVYITEHFMNPMSRTLHVFDLEDKPLLVSFPCPILDPKWTTSFWLPVNSTSADSRVNKFSGFLVKKRVAFR